MRFAASEYPKRVSNSASLRAIPVDDRAWLIAALDDALQGGAPVLPVGPNLSEAEVLQLQQSGLPAGTAVVVRTSGSTGIPKAVALSALALESSAHATHERFGGAGQWLVTLPTHLISGLQMLVRSRIAGTEPVFYDGGFDPASFIAAAATMDHERRYASLVPVQLARLFEHVQGDDEAAEVLRSFAAVLVGGQATSLALRQQAHELGVNLRRSYGMSETAGGCVYDGVEIGDTRVRVREGEVQLAGSCLALGYVGNEALTRDRFIVEQGSDGSESRWYRTGDAGDLLGGMLTVTGRLDRVIISGGVNVSLDEVERVVQELPGWRHTVALSAPHQEWGERVTLVRENDQGSGETEFDRVREIVKAKLGPAAEPLWVNETDYLPRLSGGKPDFAAIEQWITELRASFCQLGGTR